VDPRWPVANPVVGNPQQRPAANHSAGNIEQKSSSSHNGSQTPTQTQKGDDNYQQAEKQAEKQAQHSIPTMKTKSGTAVLAAAKSNGRLDLPTEHIDGRSGGGGVSATTSPPPSSSSLPLAPYQWPIAVTRWRGKVTKSVSHLRSLHRALRAAERPGLVVCARHASGTEALRALQLYHAPFTPTGSLPLATPDRDHVMAGPGAEDEDINRCLPRREPAIMLALEPGAPPDRVEGLKCKFVYRAGPRHTFSARQLYPRRSGGAHTVNGGNDVGGSRGGCSGSVGGGWPEASATTHAAAAVAFRHHLTLGAVAHSRGDGAELSLYDKASAGCPLDDPANNEALLLDDKSSAECPLDDPANNEALLFDGRFHKGLPLDRGDVSGLSLDGRCQISDTQPIGIGGHVPASYVDVGVGRGRLIGESHGTLATWRRCDARSGDGNGDGEGEEEDPFGSVALSVTEQMAVVNSAVHAHLVRHRLIGPGSRRTLAIGSKTEIPQTLPLIGPEGQQMLPATSHVEPAAVVLVKSSPDRWVSGGVLGVQRQII
jgi:hypothetical protein